MEVFRQFQGLEWCKPEWCFPSMSKETDDLLKSCKPQPQESQTPQDLSQVIAASEAFPIPFPIQSVRLSTLNQTRPLDRLLHNVHSTYPLIHERVVLLITHFLIFKREFGSIIEKAMYKDMDIQQFINRLLTKRAVTFMTAKDKYKLITGEEGLDGWDAVGAAHERPPLTLDRALSYDEMKVSSMLYVSGGTEFINDGARNNRGAAPEGGGFEPCGVVIGLIGPRLKRPYRMEHEDVLISARQNTAAGGYGEETPTTCLHALRTYGGLARPARHMWRQMWAEFYQVPSLTYEEVTSSAKIPHKQDDRQKYTSRYVSLDDEQIFDNEVYYKRLSVSFDCALLEANDRARRQGKMAYLNVVGIGLGVWKVSGHQADVFVLALLERVRAHLRRGQLHGVADVTLAHVRPTQGVLDVFAQETEGDKRNTTEHKIFFECKKHPLGGVSVQLERREPAARLAGGGGRLLVATYPWDGNAMPGNEFWLGKLTSSGDPAAACSTQVAELHNPFINHQVNGYNTRVATSNGIVSLHDYCASLSRDAS